MHPIISLQEWCEGDHPPPSLKAAQNYYDLVEKVMAAYESRQPKQAEFDFDSLDRTEIQVYTECDGRLVFYQLHSSTTKMTTSFLQTTNCSHFVGMLLLVLLYPHTATMLKNIRSMKYDSQHILDSFLQTVGVVFAEKLAQDNLPNIGAAILDLFSSSYYTCRGIDAFRVLWSKHRDNLNLPAIAWGPVYQSSLYFHHGFLSFSFSKIFFWMLPGGFHGSKDCSENLEWAIPRFYFSEERGVSSADSDCFLFNAIELISNTKGVLVVPILDRNMNFGCQPRLPSHWQDDFKVPMFSLTDDQMCKRPYFFYNLSSYWAAFVEADLGDSLALLANNQSLLQEEDKAEIIQQLCIIFHDVGNENNWPDKKARGYWGFDLTQAYWHKDRRLLRLAPGHIGRVGEWYTPSGQKKSIFLPPEARKKHWIPNCFGKKIAVQITDKDATWVVAMLWLAFWGTPQQGSAAGRLLIKMLEVKPKDRCPFSEVMAGLSLLTGRDVAKKAIA